MPSSTAAPGYEGEGIFGRIASIGTETLLPNKKFAMHESGLKTLPKEPNTIDSDQAPNLPQRLTHKKVTLVLQSDTSQEINLHPTDNPKLN